MQGEGTAAAVAAARGPEGISRSRKLKVGAGPAPESSRTAGASTASRAGVRAVPARRPLPARSFGCSPRPPRLPAAGGLPTRSGLDGLPGGLPSGSPVVPLRPGTRPRPPCSSRPRPRAGGVDVGGPVRPLSRGGACERGWGRRPLCPWELGACSMLDRSPEVDAEGKMRTLVGAPVPPGSGELAAARRDGAGNGATQKATLRSGGQRLSGGTATHDGPGQRRPGTAALVTADAAPGLESSRAGGRARPDSQPTAEARRPRLALRDSGATCHRPGLQCLRTHSSWL